MEAKRKKRGEKKTDSTMIISKEEKSVEKKRHKQVSKTPSKKKSNENKTIGKQIEWR